MTGGQPGGLPAGKDPGPAAPACPGLDVGLLGADFVARIVEGRPIVGNPQGLDVGLLTAAVEVCSRAGQPPAAAWTIATMSARIGSGNSAHLSRIMRKSGSETTFPASAPAQCARLLADPLVSRRFRGYRPDCGSGCRGFESPQPPLGGRKAASLQCYKAAPNRHSGG